MMLQERCRKDPLSYQDDFVSQRTHFDALLTSAALRPSDPSPRLAEVAAFMGSVAHCYAHHAPDLAPLIAKFLTDSALAMHPDLRRALVKLLCLLRARDAADPNLIIPLFFRLLACNDKPLRRILHGHIVADIKKINTGGNASRKSLQSYLFTMASDPNQLLVKRSLHVLVDLFRKRVWNDAKCANMIAFTCFHQSMPVAIIAANFLLDSESKTQTAESDDEVDGDAPHTTRDGQKAAELWKIYNLTGKKSSKKRKRMEKVINRVTKVKNTPATTGVSEIKAGHPALEAMMLLNDPQEFAERLFTDLQTRRKNESYENRLILINLISRLVGMHELILFNFYPFLQRYLHPAQPEVTRVLAYLTQACHDKVPSDVLHPILRGLADSFVSERSSPPSMAAGINTIRAICCRVPLAILDDGDEYKSNMDQEASLLLDLVQYKTFKDKGVMAAARSLLALYREVHPALLQKRDRGRSGAVAVQKGDGSKVKAFGEHVFATGVSGVELLENGASQSNSEAEAEGGEGSQADSDDGDGASVDSGEEEDDEHDEVNGVPPTDSNNNEGHEDSRNDTRANKSVIDKSKILTDEDFARIRALQAAKSVGESGIVESGQVVDPDEIEGPVKRQRQNLDERLESVKQGREGRDKFGSRKGTDKGGGSSNKQKLKSKSNAMVIHKRRKRSKKMSRREKQLAMRKKKDYR